MRIGLVAVDGHSNFPNLALMKLSAWHKAQGDLVEWATPLFGDYDRVYKSKIFTFTPDDYTPWNCEVIEAGTGYRDYTTRLTDAQEHVCPDYSLYPDFDAALGFTTRGCINNCLWCIVPGKEGKIRANADIDEFLAGRRKVVLLDNNILAHPHGVAQLKKCADRGLHVDCNQGMDARLVTCEIAEVLAGVKWIRGRIRFAADTTPMIRVVKQAIDRVRGAGYTGEFFIYALLAGDMDECVNRILELKNYDPKIYIHAQPYRDFYGKTVPPQWQKDLAFYCNKRMIYKSVDLCDFRPRKHFVFSEYFKQ